MKKIYLSLFTVLFTFLSIAQVDRSKMPEPGPAPVVDLGETKSFTLENGLKVFVVQNDKLPKVSFSLRLDVDPIKEGNKAGTSDLAGDLMSKGTTTKTKDEINFAVDFIGARFGTSASSVFGSSLKKHQEKLLSIMADVVMNSDFKQEELDKLKTQYLSGIQSEKDDPDAIATNVRRVLLYGKDHPYGEIVTEETIENITLDDVKNYYSTFVKPNIAYMAVVGDINLKEAKKLVTKYFANWKKGEVPTFDYPMPEAPKMPQVAFVNKPGAVQSIVSVFNTIDLKPGSEDAIKASVTNGILGGGFVSKLNLNLREEHAYTYGARSGINSDELVGSFLTSANVRNEVTDSAINETMNELMAMLKGDITQDELDAQQKYSTGVFAYSLENAQTKARFAINTERYNLPADYYANYLKNLNAVTLEDVKMISQKYIKPMNGYIMVVGNKDEVADKVKALSPTGEITFYDTYGNIEEDKPLEAAPEGVTGKSVVESYLMAITETSKVDKAMVSLKKLNSTKKMADVTITGAPPMTMEVAIQMPNKYMSNMAAGAMAVQKQVFDGTKGKTTGMMGNSDMGEEEIAKMHYEGAVVPEMRYLDGKVKLEIKGVDQMNGESVYVVDATLPSGSVKTNYFSVKSGLLISTVEMMETPQGSFTKEESYEDYKKVGNYMFAHKMGQSVGPQQVTVVYNKIEVNPSIDAATFVVE